MQPAEGCGGGGGVALRTRGSGVGEINQLRVAQQVKKFPTHSLPCLQQSGKGSYPEPD
jgi:hypothetical protein